MSPVGVEGMTLRPGPGGRYAGRVVRGTGQQVVPGGGDLVAGDGAQGFKQADACPEPVSCLLPLELGEVAHGEQVDAVIDGFDLCRNFGWECPRIS